MIMSRSRHSRDGVRVFQSKPTTRGDLDPSGRQRYESRQNRSARENIRRASGGQDASTTRLDHRFEGRLRIGCLIEGAMERHSHGTSHFNQLAGRSDRNRAIRIQKSDADSACPEALRHLQRIGYESEGLPGEYESVGFGTKKDMYWQTAQPDRILNQRPIRCEPRDLNIRTDLDSVGASQPGCNAGPRRLCTKLEDDAMTQKTRSRLSLTYSAKNAAAAIRDDEIVILAWIRPLRLNKLG